MKFGITILPKIKKNLLIKATKLTKGKALDIGAGDGFDSLFLALKGFQVTALEKNKHFADDINSIEQPNITTINQDIRDFGFSKYDLIKCSFVLHFLKEEARDILKKIKDNTNEKGINLIITFLDIGEFENNHIGLFKTNELKQIYAGWEILTYLEKQIKTKERNTDGSFKKQMAAFLLAIKPISPS